MITSYKKQILNLINTETDLQDKMYLEIFKRAWTIPFNLY